MECKRSAFLIILILSFTSSRAFAARTGIPRRSVFNEGIDDPVIVEDWRPIFNLTDPHVVAVAQFAVDEHNKGASEKLTLIAIASGEQLDMGSMVYKLVIVAKDVSDFDAPTLDYHVEVFEFEGQRTLLSFEVTRGVKDIGHH